MPWAIGIGLGSGLLKSEVVDRPREERQRKLQSQLAAYSPWSGIAPDLGAIREADPFGSALQYGATGASIKSAYDKDASEKLLNEAYADRLNSGGSMLGYGKNFSQNAALPSFEEWHSKTNPLFGNQMNSSTYVKREPWSF